MPDETTILNFRHLMERYNLGDEMFRPLDDLLHGDEMHVWGDSAYAGQKRLLYEKAPNTKDFTQKKGSRNRKLTAAE